MRYQSIHQVPKRWRAIQGTPLSLDQIDSVLTEAESSKKPFAVAFGEARRSFLKQHAAASGRWIKKGAKN